MKRKIKDLTVKEILVACRNRGHYCPGCPFYIIFADILPCGALSMTCNETDIEDLEQEVEL